MKTTNFLKTLSASVLLLSALLLTTVTAYADTDGTEMQVEQPSVLEIQLGPAWAGVEFQLKTDSGLYPGTIAVGEDGVLRTELGGSTGYVLSCLGSAVPAPAPEDVSLETRDDTNEPEEEPDALSEPDTTSPEGNDLSTTREEDNEEPTVGGIPVKHIILFAGGLLLAIGCLAGITVARKRRMAGGANKAYEEDEDDW